MPPRRYAERECLTCGRTIREGAWGSKDSNWKKHVEAHRFYVTTFCNFAHRVATGRPIGHECYILNPKVLRKEADEGAEAAMEMVRAGHPLHGNQIVRGRA